MTARRQISIARDFSPFPAGRYEKDGPFSGQACRRRILVPALKAGSVVVDLDGTLGYGSSFLEETFGGLVREEGFSPGKLRDRLELKSSDRALKAEIWSYIDDAGSRHPA